MTTWVVRGICYFLGQPAHLAAETTSFSSSPQSKQLAYVGQECIQTSSKSHLSELQTVKAEPSEHSHPGLL